MSAGRGVAAQERPAPPGARIRHWLRCDPAPIASGPRGAARVLDFSRLIVLFAPAALFLLLYGLHHPDVPLLNPDSPSYLDFAAYRSGGYPAFLALLKPIAGAGYVVAQLVLYAASVTVLGRQILATYDNPLWCLVAEVVLLGNPQVNQFHFQIFTESLFLSTSALFLAALIAHLRTGAPASLAAASACAAYALTIRPTGLVLVAAIPLLLLAAPGLGRRVVLRLGAAILPVILVLGAEAIYYHVQHPGPRETLLPIQAIGKAGLVDVTDPAALVAAAPPAARPLQAALENELAPVRKLVAGAPSIPARCRLAANYETFVEYQFAPVQRAALASAEGAGGLTGAGLARLRHGIPSYIRLTGDYLFCLWTVWAASNASKAALATYLAAHQPLPFADAMRGAFETSRSPPFVGVMQAGMLAIAGLLLVAAAVMIGVLLRRRRPTLELAVCGLCGLVMHGGLLLTALAGVGIARYLLGLWTPLAVGVLFALLWILARVALHVRLDPGISPVFPS